MQIFEALNNSSVVFAIRFTLQNILSFNCILGFRIFEVYEITAIKGGSAAQLANFQASPYSLLLSIRFFARHLTHAQKPDV